MYDHSVILTTEVQNELLTIQEGTTLIERLHRLYSGARTEVIKEAVAAKEITPDMGVSLFAFCYGPISEEEVSRLLGIAYASNEPRLQ